VPEPTFLWWDVRPQPRFGTIEVRIMDAQTTLADTAALAALVQSIVRLEVEEGAGTYDCGIPPEVLDENRFLAARDGMEAELIAHDLNERIRARDLLEDLLVLCRPHAEALGCSMELDMVSRLADRTGARRQLELSRTLGSLPRVVAVLADDFLAGA
jgi:carboxylate-amine ligase